MKIKQSLDFGVWSEVKTQTCLMLLIQNTPIQTGKLKIALFTSVPGLSAETVDIMLLLGLHHENLPPAPCLPKQVPTKRAEIKALTVNSVQISSCLNMCYKNLWCYRKRRNLEEKVRLSLRITAPQGPASTWSKEMYLKEMFASRLYPLPIFKILVSILYNLAIVSRITKPE